MLSTPVLRQTNSFASAIVTAFLDGYIVTRAIRRRPLQLWGSLLPFTGSISFLHSFWPGEAVLQLGDANAHIQQAKLHAANNCDSFALACVMRLQALVWHRQCRFEEAESKGLCAVDAFEKLGKLLGRATTVSLSKQCQSLFSADFCVWMGSQNPDDNSIDTCLELSIPTLLQANVEHLVPSIFAARVAIGDKFLPTSTRITCWCVEVST